MRHERVAPRDPVVAVVVLHQAHVPALRRQGRGHEEVVVEVLLAGPAGDGHRDRLRGAPSARDTRDEAGDAGEAAEAGLVRVVAAPEEAARLQQQAAKEPRSLPLGMEERERAEAGAHPDRRARKRRQLVERRDPLLPEHARVAVRGGVHLVAVEGRRQQRGPERRHLAERHQVVEEPQELGVARVLRPVVDEHKRQRRLRVGLGRRPDRRIDRRAEEMGREARLEHRTARGFVVGGPFGSGVPRKLDHRLLAERPGRAERVRRIRQPLDVPVAVVDLEQVLEAVDRRPRQLQPPPACLAQERNDARLPQLVRERDARHSPRPVA